jgi:hypothetical protein
MVVLNTFHLNICGDSECFPYFPYFPFFQNSLKKIYFKQLLKKGEIGEIGEMRIKGTEYISILNKQN